MLPGHNARALRLGLTPIKRAVQAFRKRFSWLKHTPNAVLACVALALVLYALHLDSGAKIVPVEVTGSQVFLRPQKTYQDAAKDAL